MSEDPITLEEIKTIPIVETLIRVGNANLEVMGFTEHGFRHISLVSSIAYNVLRLLGYPQREAELARIAGYLHDIGNVVNRSGHHLSGAILAYYILDQTRMPHDEVFTVVSAIGNHDEDTGQPVNNVAAAIILADKSDVHRTRVRNKNIAGLDIHDRVNYAVERSFLRVDPESKQVLLEIDIDPHISPVMDYFEIFLSRMMMCRRAAEFLGCTYGLVINDKKLV
ncbi:MAG: HD domain-containing protein [Thermacetogeniaceae bacterium]|jgi:metal-dependent HD superfamily phosphatase/phosphodiesterase|nr:HD domain-containing protein [Thermoanaerobacterales bacterium]